jgi:hypothetical protein
VAVSQLDITLINVRWLANSLTQVS